MTEFEKVKLETVRFLRGKYRLDEVSDGTEQVKFKQGTKTIVTIAIHKDKLNFLIIFGKAEREKFEGEKSEFSQAIRSFYDNSRTYHDGKWMFIDVSTLELLEEIKKLILIKKKPNRKPFLKENAVYGKCGHRCDLCVHYTEIAEEFREMLIPHLASVYGGTDWSMRCTGCDTPGCQCYTSNDICEPLKCLPTKQLTACADCKDYPCERSTVGYNQLESKNMSADDVTWAVLPYVPHQYEEF